MMPGWPRAAWITLSSSGTRSSSQVWASSDLGWQKRAAPQQCCLLVSGAGWALSPLAGGRQHVSHSGQGFVCLTYNSVLFSFINYICLRFSKRFILKIVTECQHECATDREGRTLGTLPSLCLARPSAPTCAVSSHAPWHPHTCALKGSPPTVGLWFQLLSPL